MRKSPLHWWTLAAACGMSFGQLAAAQTPASYLGNQGSPYHLLPVPGAAGTPTPIERGHPYVTTCYVTIDAPEPAPLSLAVLPVSNLSVEEEVKRAIERLPGSGISSVRVILENNNKITVHLAAQSEVEAKRYWDRIQALPELHSYRLEVQLYLRK